MPRRKLKDRQVDWRRLLRVGLAIAALAGLSGGALELLRFGRTDAAAAARVESHVRRKFDAMTAALSRIANSIANDPAAGRGLAPPGDEGARALFDLVTRSAGAGSDEIAVTIYDANGVAVAWEGRPSDIFGPNPSPKSALLRDRINGAPAYFVTPSPRGLRLLHTVPLVAADRRRLGAVAVEHVLSPTAAAAAITATDYTLSTSLAPVSLRMRYEGAGDVPRPGAFVLRAPSGEALVEATISDADLQRARREWRGRVAAVVMAICGVVLVLLIGPLLDARAAARASAIVARQTVAASVLVLAGAAAMWAALRVATGHVPRTPVTLLVLGAAAAALAALWAGPLVRLRVAVRGRRFDPGAAPARFGVSQLIAGVAVIAVLVAFERLLATVVNPATVDLRHYSLHPWDTARLLVLGGIVGLCLAAVWTGTLVLVAAAAPWRLSRGSYGGRAAAVALWLAPAVLVSVLTRRNGWSLPVGGVLASALIVTLAALVGPRLVAWYRRATVAARIFALFLAFLVPTLLLYPSVDFYADRAIRRLIETRYAVEAQNHAQTLQDRMAEAMRQIDALTILPDLVTGASDVLLTAPRTESAFLVWSQTALARERLTSDIELYDREGALISRFALNFPEYTGASQKPQEVSTCRWDLFGEALPFGSEERNMLHAAKRICVADPDGGPPHPLGTIVVHVVFDYRTLPFITSGSPYFELFRPAESRGPHEGTAGGDVAVAIYGWGLTPIYTSGRLTWTITDATFERLYDPARRPFWVRLAGGDPSYNVHFSNDRRFIYAIGYPALTVFDRFVHLAELTTLAGTSFVIVLLGTAFFTRISRSRPRVGRALLREIRASFYRKLFLAFVLAAIVPVLTLALVIRAYFADLLRKDVQAEAAHTAAVARRVIEGSDALLRRGANELAPVNDDVMVWISQIIDQDVNIFDGAHLFATSERDLFASGLLPTRTPDDVYRAIALQRLSSFVDEDQIGTFTYMIAATPVRTGGHDDILTVPFATRQREIERQIDDLDRGVHLAALFFILLGAVSGLWLAERIADPVRRLTRATRRIAGGDFDARIAVKSADELKRLVDAFNSMAAELKAQRAQLERTHRIEAWAEMARQVAHEIKNPLTPIQLSAEHLRRVHADRGAPMGPVLEGCVDSILNQVRLLRQISAEFSSFASSPTARPAAVDVPELVAEVIDPYRTGLQGRIEIENRVRGPLPRVHVDRTLITRALANIVENALHAMPGGGRITIEATASERGAAERPPAAAGVLSGSATRPRETVDSQLAADRVPGRRDAPHNEPEFVTLTIRDTGVGMDQESLERVFEPYFSTKTTGTGLGLPIARRNIELSGGAIEVESEKGVGTVVRINLPIN